MKSPKRRPLAKPNPKTGSALPPQWKGHANEKETSLSAPDKASTRSTHSIQILRCQKPKHSKMEIIIYIYISYIYIYHISLSLSHETKGICGLQQSGKRTETVYMVLSFKVTLDVFPPVSDELQQKCRRNNVGTKENTQQGMNQLSTGYFSTCGTIKINYFHIFHVHSPPL